MSISYGLGGLHKIRVSCFLAAVTYCSCPGPSTISALTYSAVAVTPPGVTYANNFQCVVTVGGVNGGVPTLNFMSFSTKYQDYVLLYDGGNTLAPVLGEYTWRWGAALVGVPVSGSSGMVFPGQLEAYKSP